MLTFLEINLLLDKARALGAKSIDIQGVKVVFATAQTAEFKNSSYNEIRQPVASILAPVQVPPTVDAADPTDDPIEHKTVELTSVMKLSDNQLLDSLFPDHTDYKELED
jgi:hypothetical protein